MELDTPKRNCPFQVNYRCNTKCAWFDIKKNQCIIWSFYGNVTDFIKIIQDYISLQLKIRNGQDS